MIFYDLFCLKVNDKNDNLEEKLKFKSAISLKLISSKPVWKIKCIAKISEKIKSNKNK